MRHSFSVMEQTGQGLGYHLSLKQGSPVRTVKDGGFRSGGIHHFCFCRQSDITPALRFVTPL
jgi:hypothetical protein